MMSLATICRAACLTLHKASATWRSDPWLKCKLWLTFEGRDRNRAGYEASYPFIFGPSRIYNTYTSVFQQTSSYSVATGGQRLQTKVFFPLIEFPDIPFEKLFVGGRKLDNKSNLKIEIFTSPDNSPYVLVSAGDAKTLEKEVQRVKL